MHTKEEIAKRFEMLIVKGNQLLSTVGPEVISISQYGGEETNPDGYEYWIPTKSIPEFKSWLISASNLIHFLLSSQAPLAQDCDRIMTSDDLKQGVSSNAVVLMLGLLAGAKDEWDHGFLGNLVYIITSSTFDDFLDHAAEYHRANKKIESAILGSAVLEDTIKKIAQKNEIQTEGKTLEPLINALAKANVFTSVKAKRIRVCAGVRNHALHAEWEKFEISDVGVLIDGTRELLDNYL